MFFHFILRRGTATSPKEDRGREHPKEAEGGSTTKRIVGGGGKHHRPKEGGEGQVILLGEWCFFLFRVGVGGERRVLFPCPPLGGADFPPFPCWMVPFFFLKNEETFKKIKISKVNCPSSSLSVVRLSSASFRMEQLDLLTPFNR